MKAISTGNDYVIYDDSLKVYDVLPPQSYKVVFSKQRGFFLEKYLEPDHKEAKIYGDHNAKVDKVLRAFQRSPRSLGVILSGAKGIGKTLFAKLLGLSAIRQNMPLLVIDRYIPGIAAYLESIEQECMVFFDEFDKTFGGVKQGDGMADPQTEMLALFDGIAPGKKLFVVTCNQTRNLSNYLINRPGRFHYHFRFEYPSNQEIETYLKDKIDEKYWDQIPDVLKFAVRIPLNYDCLRAIAFELSDGVAFKEAIKIMNIVNLETTHYRVTTVFNNGQTITQNRITLDMFSNEEQYFSMEAPDGSYLAEIWIKTQDAVYDMAKNVSIVNKDAVHLDDFATRMSAEMKAAVDAGVHHLEIRRMTANPVHYAV